MRWVAALLIVCVTGCGLTMTQGPDPRAPPDQRPVCTETMDAPKRDSIGALVGAIAMLVGAVGVKVGDDDDHAWGVPLLVGGGALFVGSYISGGVGYFRVKRCRRAIQDWELRRGPSSDGSEAVLSAVRGPARRLRGDAFAPTWVTPPPRPCAGKTGSPRTPPIGWGEKSRVDRRRGRSHLGRT